MSHPNILFLMGDEHPVFMNGCYGHRSAQTPTLDALSASGATFDAAYCASPLCAPSRAALLAGRHIHTLETWDNASPFRSDWPTFAHSFRYAGYRTILCGKMHFVGPDQMHGFEERWTQDIYPADFQWTRKSREWSIYNDGQNVDRVMEAGIGWTKDMDYDEEVLFRALYGLRRISAEKPFMLCVSFTGPHYPFKAPQEYWDHYTDDDVDLPKMPADFARGDHAHVKWLRDIGGYNTLVSDDICRTARHAILGRISMLDDYLAKILRVLREQRLDEDTIIVYTSDHGDMMGEHGLWFKQASYEWSSRVPLLFSGPGIPAGHRSAEPVSLLDMGSTLCGLAGIESLNPRPDGRDITDLVQRTRADGPGLAIMENYSECLWRGIRTVRRGNCKLNITAGSEPEMYDLANDPDEWHNIAQDEAYLSTREELERLALTDWNPDALDEQRWQSEERRDAIMRAAHATQSYGWQYPSPSPEHPIGVIA